MPSRPSRSSVEVLFENRVRRGEAFVAVDGLADVGALFVVGAGEEAALETGGDDVAEFARVELELVHGELQFLRHGRVGHEAVVRADGDGEVVVQHLAERVPRQEK